MRVQDNTLAPTRRRLAGPELPAHGMPQVPDDPALIVEERRRATRAVAAASHDAADCALLLDALGLNPSEGKR